MVNFLLLFCNFLVICINQVQLIHLIWRSWLCCGRLQQSSNGFNMGTKNVCLAMFSNRSPEWSQLGIPFWWSWEVLWSFYTMRTFWAWTIFFSWIDIELIFLLHKSILSYCMHKCTISSPPDNFRLLLHRYDGQRDMIYNQTYNLDQVSFATEGLKDAQQTVCYKVSCLTFIVPTCFLLLIHKRYSRCQHWSLLTRSWKGWWRLWIFRL